MTVSLSQDRILEYLLERKFEANIQPETQQISAKLAAGKEKYAFFARLDEQANLLQLFVFLPYALPKQFTADVARLLHFFNKEIDFPGFGIDETEGVIFYRCTLLGTQGYIQKDILDKVIDALPKLCEAFFPTIALAIAGKIRFDAILEKSKKLKKES